MKRYFNIAHPASFVEPAQGILSYFFAEWRRSKSADASLIPMTSQLSHKNSNKNYGSLSSTQLTSHDTPSSASTHNNDYQSSSPTTK